VVEKSLVPSQAGIPAANERSRQPFPDKDWPVIAETLEREFIRLLPLIESVSN